MNTHECPATKTCSKCGEEKPQTDFYQSRKTKVCKACELESSRVRYKKNRKKIIARQIRNRENNKESVREYHRKRYLEKRDEILARSAEYRSLPEVKEREAKRQRERYAANRKAIQAARKEFYQKNPEAREAFEQYQRHYYRENKDKFVARSNRRRAVKVSACPTWADRAKMSRFYREARKLTKETGIKHVVDHIVPLQGELVCGLHVETNLQVITQKANLEKFNKFG